MNNIFSSTNDPVTDVFSTVPTTTKRGYHYGVNFIVDVNDSVGLIQILLRIRRDLYVDGKHSRFIPSFSSYIIFRSGDGETWKVQKLLP